jgi:hypothetical protein
VAQSSCGVSTSVSSRSAARYFSANEPTDESSTQAETQTAAIVAPERHRDRVKTASHLLRGDGVALLADMLDFRTQRFFVGDGEGRHHLGFEMVEPGVERRVRQLAHDGATGRGVEGGTPQPDGGRQHVGACREWAIITMS